MLSLKKLPTVWLVFAFLQIPSLGHAQSTFDQLYNYQLMEGSRCGASGGEWTGMTCNSSPNSTYNPQIVRELFGSLLAAQAREYDKPGVCRDSFQYGLDAKAVVNNAKHYMKMKGVKKIIIYDHPKFMGYAYTLDYADGLGTDTPSLKHLFGSGKIPRQAVCYSDTTWEKLGMVARIDEKRIGNGERTLRLTGKQFFLDRVNAEPWKAPLQSVSGFTD